jgi:copper chaperone
MNSVTYHIPSINCNHCVHTIKTELSEVEGVKDVQADLQSKEITIQYEGPADESKFETLLSEINYPVEK